MAHYILNQHVGVATSVIDNNDKRTLKSHTFIVALERVLGLMRLLLRVTTTSVLASVQLLLLVG